MAEKKKFSERTGDVLIDVAIKGSFFAVFGGLVTKYIVAPQKMHQQIEDHVSPGDSNWSGRNPDQVTLEQANDQAWARIQNFEDTYRKGDIHGSDLAGQHIDGSTEFILGHYTAELGFFVWGLAMIYKHVYRN